jgi:undecaprenyl-diphosphatase
MRLLTGWREADRLVAQQTASGIPPRVAKVLSAVEESAESTKLWCSAAVAVAGLSGWRGRQAAASGLAALVVAQLISNGLCKQLADRARPPKEWFPHDEVDDRPDPPPSPPATLPPRWPSPRLWHPHGRPLRIVRGTGRHGGARAGAKWSPLSE